MEFCNSSAHTVGHYFCCAIPYEGSVLRVACCGRGKCTRDDVISLNSIRGWGNSMSCRHKLTEIEPACSPHWVQWYAVICVVCPLQGSGSAHEIHPLLAPQGTGSVGLPASWGEWRVLIDLLSSSAQLGCCVNCAVERRHTHCLVGVFDTMLSATQPLRSSYIPGTLGNSSSRLWLVYKPVLYAALYAAACTWSPYFMFSYFTHFLEVFILWLLECHQLTDTYTAYPVRYSTKVLKCCRLKLRK